jgi:hypothetical protein
LSDLLCPGKVLEVLSSPGTFPEFERLCKVMRSAG